MTLNLKPSLKTELIKLLNYRTFVILTLIYLALLFLVFLSIQGFLNNITINSGNQGEAPPVQLFSVYKFPDIWQNLSYLAGHLKIFPAFLIIILITNEFSFNTHKQIIISGVSRDEFILGKVVIIAIFSILVSLMVGISAFFLGIFQSEVDYSAILSPKLWFIAAHALELFTYLNLAALFAFIFRKTGITILVFLLYSVVVERIIALNLPENISNYLPLNAIGNLIPLPNSPLMKLFGINFNEFTYTSDVISCIIYSVVFIVLMFVVLRKRDL